MEFIANADNCGETPTEDSSVKQHPTECKSCQTKFDANKKAIHCRWCDKWEKDEDCDYDAYEDVDPITFYCRPCTRKCWYCELRGCEDCVKIVCCDCSVRMCTECANSDVLCGCYGKCYSCGCDVDRGSDGWPCGECDKWFCGDCRYCDNECQECNPREESSDESDEQDESDEPDAPDAPDAP